MTEIVATSQYILVVGGGKHAILAEKSPTLGGRTALLYRYFPSQANAEVYQSEINRKQGTKFDMPVTCYSQPVAVAYGATPEQAGLDGHIVKPKKLQEIAVKVVPAKKA